MERAAVTPVNFRARRCDAAAIDRDVAYAFEIFELYRDALPAGLASLTGARVLELGPGPSYGTALLLACAGATVTVADPYLASWDAGYHEPFFGRLLERAAAEGIDTRRMRTLLEARAFGPAAFERVSGRAEQLDRIPDASIDIVFSTAVLEHVGHVPRAFEQLARVTTPGGWHFHQVDFRDHRNFDAPLEYLTLDAEAFWIMFALRSGECGNRWRYATMHAAFEQAGLEVVGFHPDLKAPDDYVAGVRPRLHPDFQTMSDDELGTLIGRFACRRLPRQRRAADFTPPGLIPPAGVGSDWTRASDGDRGIVVYGAGGGGRHALDELARLQLDDRVVAVCDGDASKHGTHLGAHRIRPFEDVRPSDYSIVIVASDPGRRAVSKQLAAEGLVEIPEFQALGFISGFVRPRQAARVA